jgi:cytoskeleton protein RodZ
MENNRYDTAAQQGGTASEMPLPGAVLAAARVARGMSVEDISRALKLPVAKIMAIEADDHSSLPSAAFARGFIRGYARLVKVDIEPMLPAKAAPAAPVDVRLMHLHHVPGVSLEPKRYRQLPMMAAGAMFVLLGLAYYEFVLNAPSTPFQVSGGVSVQPSLSGSPVPDDAVPDALRTPVIAPLGQASRPAGTVDNPLRLKKSIDPSSGANEQGLHFLFNGESWVEVRDAVGKVVFSSTNAPGSERIVRGAPPFSLVIGGASGVQLNYNGSRVDLASYVTADVARLRLE